MTHIHDLPDEVLAHIFDYSLGDRRTGGERIARVCKRWYDVYLTNVLLWLDDSGRLSDTYIRLMYDSRWRVVHHRHERRFPMVTCVDSRVMALKGYCEFLASCPNIEHLVITEESREAILKIVSVDMPPLRTLEANLELHELNISDRTRRSDRKRRSERNDIEGRFSRLVTPRIERLGIRMRSDAEFPFSIGFECPRLVELCVDMTENLDRRKYLWEKQSSLYIDELMRNCPNVRVLSLGGIHLRIRDRMPDSRLIELYMEDCWSQRSDFWKIVESSRTLEGLHLRYEGCHENMFEESRLRTVRRLTLTSLSFDMFLRFKRVWKSSWESRGNFDCVELASNGDDGWWINFERLDGGLWRKTGYPECVRYFKSKKLYCNKYCHLNNSTDGLCTDCE